MEKKKILAVTMGDPAGVGPEIAVKAFSHREIYEYCRPLVIGDPLVMKEAAQICGKEEMKIHPIWSIREADFKPGSIDVFRLDLIDEGTLKRGTISKEAGEAAYRSVEWAVHLAMEKRVDATVTAPINKEALHLAGYPYSGHTEIYAALTQTEKYTMMLAYENLRVVHVSTHVSLREACERVKKKRVLDVIELAYEACRQIGISSPRIGVAGLNPHCGEGGLFGREEAEEIRPAVEAARSRGICVEGPIPADTIFSKARGGWYDMAVAMYHDQGHIPLKLAGFRYDQEKKRWEAVSGVNITLGLPIIRTSVDHGTAFDQAGLGTACEESLLNAMEYAARMANTKETDKEETK